MDDTSPKLTIDDLIGWGLLWEEHLRAGPRGLQFEFGSDWTVLEQYVIAANAALRQQCEQERKKARKKPKEPGSAGGRPRGGMGEQVLRRMSNGMKEHTALRITAKEYDKPQESVVRAFKRVKKALQRTPR